VCVLCKRCLFYSVFTRRVQSIKNTEINNFIFTDKKSNTETGLPNSPPPRAPCRTLSRTSTHMKPTRMVDNGSQEGIRRRLTTEQYFEQRAQHEQLTSDTSYSNLRPIVLAFCAMGLLLFILSLFCVGYNPWTFEEARSATEATHTFQQGRLKADNNRLFEENSRLRTAVKTELEKERAAMEKIQTFQTSKILLNVGGRRFETSLHTLTQVPGTYFSAMFSGRFELTPSADGAYSVDRDGVHFRHVLNCLRDYGSFKLSSDMTDGQKEELAVEIKFYGLLNCMKPYYTQELVGQALLQRASLIGTKFELQTAVAQARVLVFEMGSTTPFLSAEFQDLRFIITDRVVNGSPVWAAVGDMWFMFRSANGEGMVIGGTTACVEGSDRGTIIGVVDSIVAPTELPFDEWLSNAYSTLELQYTTAVDASDDVWVHVPDMYITVVHELDDSDLTMAAALWQLATFSSEGKK